MKRIREFIELNTAGIIKDLQDLINIPTVSKPWNDADSSKNIKKGLQWIIDKATELELIARCYDDFVEVEVGKGDRVIAAICHVDVVDAYQQFEKKWDYWLDRAFNSRVENGKIIGRGAIDNKSSIIACLYALKYIKDNTKINENAKLKLIIGTDEETGEWECINSYKKYSKEPDIAFVPDDSFPYTSVNTGCTMYEVSTLGTEDSVENSVKT